MQNQSQPHGINFQWKCIDLETNSDCRDIQDNVIVIISSDNLVFPSFTFVPYSLIQITLEGEKDGQSLSSQIVIQFTDDELPIVKINLKDEINLNNIVNMNQIIYADIELDPTENINDYYFGGIIVYNNKIQASMKFEYNKIRFQIWNYFSSFQINESQFSVKFTVYNPKFSIPSSQTINFILNFPPQNCVLTTVPTSGFSISTLFKFSLTNCEDPDQPIIKDQYDYEILNPLLIQRKQITDQTYDSTAQTQLPEGEILLLVQAIDSKNAIFNMTQQISVKSSNLNKDDYVKLVTDTMNYAKTQPQSSRILTLALLSEDMIIKQQLYFQYIHTKSSLIINDLYGQTNDDYEASTFQTLATKTIADIVLKQLQQVDFYITTQHLKYIEGILLKSQTELNTQSQFKKDLYNEQLYNSFLLLDSMRDKLQFNGVTQSKSVNLCKQLAHLQNIDSLPNESAKILKGQVLSVVSQIVTLKKLSYYLGQGLTSNWEDPNQNNGNLIDDKKNQVFKVAFKLYQDNLYKDEIEFKKLIESETKKNPNLKINNYKVIDPAIKLFEQQDNDENYIQLQTQIVHTFQPLRDDKLTCINRLSGEWTRQGCQTIYDEQNKLYKCKCHSLTPTTVLNDIIDIFESKNVDTVFSEKGLQNIITFDDFYKYAAFWIVLSFTAIYFCLSLYGSLLDKLLSRNNIISPLSISQQKTNQISPFNLNSDNGLLTNNARKRSLDIKPARNSRLRNQFSQRSSLQSLDAERFRKSSKLTFSKEIEAAIKSNATSTLQTIKSSPIKQVESQKSHQTLEKISEVENEKLDNILDIQESQRQKTLNTEECLTNKSATKNDSLKIDNHSSSQFKRFNFVKQALYFHDFFGIFILFDPEMSRFIRLTVFYVKNLHLFNSNIIFNENYSIIQIIFLQIFNQILTIMVSKLIEFSYTKNTILKRILQIIIFSLIVFYFYALFSVVSGKEPSETNKISIVYLFISLIDIFITGFAISLVILFFARNLLAKKDVKGISKFIYDFIKLPLVLSNIYS